MPLPPRCTSILAVLALSSSLTGCVARGAFASSEPAPDGTSPELDDFAFALKEYTGSYAAAYVAQKLTTFDVSPACMAKMTAPSSSALHSASFYTQDIIEYAKIVTGDDWSEIETQNTNDRERNKQLIAPMIDAFGERFHLTIAVEGDDCDVVQSALWLRYWNTVGNVLTDYPPKSGVAFIELRVSAVRDVSVTVDPAGSRFAIVAPRDIEAAAWDDKIGKPFRKLARTL